MVLEDFLQKWYIEPIVTGSGYNVINTLTYALILVGLLSLIIKIFKHYNIKIDKEFLLATSPYIIFGSTLRVYEDLFEAGAVEGVIGFNIMMIDGVIRNIFLISPFIYLLVFTITILALGFSLFYEKKYNTSFKKIFFTIGILLSIITISLIPISDFQAGFLMLGMTVLSGGLVFLVGKQMNFSMENILLIIVHMFDASTTFVSILFYGYTEQHFLPSFFIGIIGPIAIYVLKLLVVPTVLHYLDKEKNSQNKIFIKLAILVLGLGPGVRNFFRVIAGV